jgi:hypothetical protein
MKKPPPETQQMEQHRRFIETARQLECDEDKERFEEKLKQIAAAKPKPKPTPEAGIKKRGRR